MMDDIVDKGQMPNLNTDYTIVRLSQSHLLQVIHLQNRVMHDLPHADELVPLSEQELTDVLGDRGYCLGVIVADKLIAFHAVLYPGAANPENLGFDLGFGPNERQAVAHLESVFVHPHFRGNGLQKKMAKLLLDYLSGHQYYRYVCETIAPTNLASLKSALASGLHIHLLKDKYDGLKRFILLRDLHAPVQLDFNTTKMVNSADHEQQHSLLGEGYRGFAVERDGEQALIHFALPKKRV